MKYIHALFLCLVFWGGAPVTADTDLPANFTLQKYADVPGARSLAVAPELGVVFVGTRSDSLYAILDEDKDGQVDSVRLLSDNLKVPNGLAWKEGALYVAEQLRLIRYVIGNTLPSQWPKAEVLYDGFPDKGWHGWRYIAFGPDGGLYVSIGAPCNICMPSGDEGTILRFDPKTWRASIFAKGIRNSVGFDFDPHNGDLVFSDNGADNMGEDVPADELNRAAFKGLHFGYPYYGGGQSRTRDFKEREINFSHHFPVWEFQAHVAPLGVHFYRGNRFPDDFKKGVFVALHGAWNRQTPVGYKIVFLGFDDKWMPEYEIEIDFIKGWLTKEGDVTGRPVDMEELVDGRLLISDDAAGAVYVVDYHQ
jgi:glucose/arabinose dehydrogenase